MEVNIFCNSGPNSFHCLLLLVWQEETIKWISFY